MNGDNHQSDQEQAAALQPAGPKHRAVDLGREDHLVTWAEWFARTSGAMQRIVEGEARKNLRFRVTLIDGRVFAVRQAMSHVSRGRCSLESTRWDEHGAVCDVVTGYQLLGEDPMGNLTMLAVTPDMIASVECVLVRPRKQEEPEPFGFASFVKLRDEEPALTEVEETIGDGDGSPQRTQRPQRGEEEE